MSKKAIDFDLLTTNEIGDKCPSCKANLTGSTICINTTKGQKILGICNRCRRKFKLGKKSAKMLED